MTLLLTERPGPDASTGVAAAADVEALVTGHVALAHKIAYDYLARAPRHTDRDDIVSAALLGLVEAARRYDPARGVAFASWASSRIYGAVVDAARGADPLPRRVRSSFRTLNEVEDHLTQTFGATPDEQQLADAAGMEVATVRKLRTELHTGVTKSLDETFPDAPDSYAATLVDADPTPLETLERRELDAYLVDAVALLPDRQREVVVGHFIHGESNADLGTRLGVTPQRISQLRSEALRRLREGVTSQFPDEFAPPSAATATTRPLTAQTSYAAAISARRTYAERLTGSL